MIVLLVGKIVSKKNVCFVKSNKKSVTFAQISIKLEITGSETDDAIRKSNVAMEAPFNGMAVNGSGGNRTARKQNGRYRQDNLPRIIRGLIRRTTVLINV